MAINLNNENPKPCPFCGVEILIPKDTLFGRDQQCDETVYYVYHPRHETCPLQNMNFCDGDWNMRVREDDILDRNNEALEALIEKVLELETTLNEMKESYDSVDYRGLTVGQAERFWADRKGP